MTELAPIKGLIELQDDFTSRLGLAEAALGNFSKSNQESLKAVAGAAGLVGAAIGAVTYATIELGKRGADVNDVNATLVHFAGGAKQADDAMNALRQGTKGTVDNFLLAKDAAHLLSAGVKLTTDDFGTLGEAAFVLQNRGLGGTKEQLELVSDAMVTGRTRALALALGVVDVGDAEENYAKQLGVTKDQLSDTGKVEAHRIAVMGMLKAAVKDAGDQERDFGEEFEFAQAQVVNWMDDLGSAIATSDVFKAGIKGVEDAVASAFSGDKSEAIDKTVGLLEDGATAVIGFAQVTITMAKVVEGVWNGVRTLILGVETLLSAWVLDFVSKIETVSSVAAKLHIISPQTLQEVKDFKLYMQGMTQSFADQTVEAAKGVFGHTKFDDTLDKLSDTLGKVKASMLSAKDATAAKTKETDKATVSAADFAKAQAEQNARMIDTAKIEAALEKSTKELGAVWSDYYKLVAAASGTSRDAQIADVQQTFNKNVEALDKMDPLFKQKYAAYAAIAKESLNEIDVDWNSVRDNSIEGMQEMADKALATYQAMTSSGLHFTREALDEQLQKYHDLQDQARGYGRSVQESVSVAASAIKLLDFAWMTDADIAAQTLSKTTVMVKTLSGEIISLAEAQKRQQQGGSFDVTSANFNKAIKDYITSGGWNPTGAGVKEYRDPTLLAKKGYSFAEIIRYAFDKAYQEALPPPQGPRIPGFAEGGVVMVGERGPEAVRLPFGSQVFPHGTSPSGQNITNHFYINGTGEQVFKQFSTLLMRQLKQGRQFPAA